VGHHRHDLVPLVAGVPDDVRERGHLGLAGAGGAHRGVGGDEVGEEHAVILPCPTDVLR
jgi:hypothetical protein